MLCYAEWITCMNPVTTDYWVQYYWIVQYMMCVHMIYGVLLQQYIIVQYCTGSMSGHCLVIYYILCYTEWMTCMNPVTTD